VVGFFVFVNRANATIYYVSVSGSDSNNGTATATPFAHHPWDANATGVPDATALQPGDTVIMKKGDIWYDAYLYPSSSGLSESPIITTTLDGFGTGEAVLSGAYDPSTLIWTADGSSYKVAMSNQTNIVIYNSVVLTRHSGVKSLVALNEWDWESDDGGTLWVNVGEDPLSGVLKAAKRNIIISLSTKNFLTFSDLTLEGANSTTAGAVFDSGGNSLILEGLTIRWFKTYGIYLSNSISGQILNCLAYNGDFTFQTGPSIFLNTSSGAIFQGNTVRNSYADAVSVWNSNYVYLSDNNLFSNHGYGIKIWNSNNGNYYRNTIYNNGYGYYGVGSQGGGGIYIGGTAKSDDNNIYRNNLYNNYIGIVLINNFGNGGNRVYSNILRDNTVNSIDNESSPDINPFDVYNNTIIHNPNLNNNSPYTGHGIDTQAGGQKNRFSNNLIVVEQTGSNSQAITISGANYDVQIDYNFYYNSTVGDINFGKIDGINYTSLSSWQSAVQDNANVSDLNGISSSAEIHSQTGNPYMVDLDANNLSLLGDSPLIDSGTTTSSMTSTTTDYAGNPLYGTPDIGAYEYQPPFTLATSLLDPTGNIRIYGDKKYRYTTATSSTMSANFSVASPETWIYSASTTRPQWLDISNITWNTSGTYSKSWTESSTSATTTVYTIGDLQPSTYYTVAVDGSASTSLQSNSSGILTYTYSAGYSTHTFTVTPDTTSPSSVSLYTPENNSSTSVNPSFTWSASADSESDISKYQIYLDGSLYTDNISSTTQSYSGTNLSCGSHTWYVRIYDNAGNTTDSNTSNFTVSCSTGYSGGGGGGGGYAAAPTPTPNPIPQISFCPQGYICTPVQSSTSKKLFTKNLSLGMTDPDVRDLQILLNALGYTISTSGYGSPNNETTYFGSLTKSALMKFQKSKGIPNTGFFGPMTRGEVNM